MKPCDHVAMQSICKKGKSWKAKESGLIRVWHNKNLFQDTSIIEIRIPHPTNINSQTGSIKKNATKTVILR